MCFNCGLPLHHPCDCQSKGHNSLCRPYPGPLETYDAKTVIYHKDNNELSQLTYLGLNNGSTLELILNTIDDKLSVLNFASSELPLDYLRDKYTFTTLPEFAIRVDLELGLLQDQITTGKTWTTAGRPTTPVPGEDGYNITTNSREYWKSSTSTWIQY